MNIIENTGTVLKFNIHIEPINGIHAEDLDFSLQFYAYTNRKLELRKEDLVKIDADNYTAIVDTALVGSGEILCRIEAHVPDNDIPRGYRTEIITIPTGENTKS